MDPETLGLIIDTVGAFVMMALAVWVWRVRPASRVNRTFATLASLLAFALLMGNISWFIFFAGRATSLARLIASVLGAGALLVVAALVVRLERVLPPSPPSTPHHPNRLIDVLPILLGALVLGRFLFMLVRFSRQGLVDLGSIEDGTLSMFGVAITMLSASAVYFVTRLAIRYARCGPGQHALRWQYATMALALGAFPFFSSSATTLEAPMPGIPKEFLDIIALLPLVAAASAWIVAGTGADGRVAIVTGLALLTIMAAAVISTARWGSITTTNSGAHGLLRIAGTGLLAYAIVRHQLFDIELRIKWGISRGTLVGIFLAVFFIGSAMAENFLTERYDWHIGGVGAGLLLFALTPLQRIADRVSTFAMPHVQDSAEYRSLRTRSIYQAAVAGALRDGHVSEEERDVLAALADELRLTAGEARALERELAAPA